MSKSKFGRWRKADFVLSNGTKFSIIHNMDFRVSAAFQNWLARTKDYTDKSFVAYIRDKDSKYKTGDYAFTMEEFDKR